MLRVSYGSACLLDNGDTGQHSIDANYALNSVAFVRDCLAFTHFIFQHGTWHMRAPGRRVLDNFSRCSHCRKHKLWLVI